jgi:hypothetical protein
MKRLNNLVCELSPMGDISRDNERVFVNPRKGFVHVSWSEGDVRLDGKTLGYRVVAGRRETMVYLSPGEAVLSTESSAGGLTVRSVADLYYCKYGSSPHVPQYGPYDHAFLEQYVLPHVNTIIGNGSPDQMDAAREWKKRGGRWIVETHLPGMSGDVTADECFEAWSTNPGMTDPDMDGIMVDEFFSGSKTNYVPWREAFLRIADDPRFTDKTFFPYVGSHFPTTDDFYRSGDGPPEENSGTFYRAVLDRGGSISWERYLQERHEESVTRKYMDGRLVESMQAWEGFYPGARRQMVVSLGYMTLTESLAIHPTVSMKYFMDMQFQYLATREEFVDLCGILEYTSSYADRETVIWAAMLYRHYGIEGNTEMLSKSLGLQHNPDHLRNPDFALHWEGWHVPIECEHNLSVRPIPGYSHLQGRWPTTTVGDTALVMHRSAERENRVSQTLRNLVPGRLYSVKLLAGDARDFDEGRSVQRGLGLRVTVEGAEMFGDASFMNVTPSNYAHALGHFDTNNQFYFNYHHAEFRAQSDTAVLVLSDWETPGEPGGLIGREIMVNWVKVDQALEA